MVWTREATETFIEEWIKMPCLYDSKHQLYYSKHARRVALEKICAAVQMHRPHTTPADCKAKLNGIRTQFAAEQHKVNRKSGPLTGEVYVSSWWPFKRLTFLADHVQSRKAILMGQNGTENPASPSSMGEVYSTVTIKREVEYPVGGAEEMGQPSSSSSSIYIASPMASPLNSDCMPPPSSPLSPPAIACELTAPPPDSHAMKDTAPRIVPQPQERVMFKDTFATDTSSPSRRTTYIRDTGGEALAQFLAYSYSQIKSHEIKINLKHIWLKALMDAELKDLSYNSPR